MKKIELLAPAGDLERLKIAVKYGADAVFIGGKKFSLRSRASNFDLAEIKEGVDFAKKYGADIHVTINMLPHDKDLEGLDEYILALDKIGVKAVICASLYIAKRVIALNCNLEVHLSTQQSTLNSQAVLFYKELGVDRVVLGRELSIDEVVDISQNSNIDIEAFIHGGMCHNYSGRCTLSNFMTLRDANRGGCAQSCRWKYHLYENNQEISLKDNLFSMSSKDLMAAEFIPQLIEGNVRSLKIEGRMKSLYYIATVIRGYRHLIDSYYNNNLDVDYYSSEISRAENRLTSTGFYDKNPDHLGHIYNEKSDNVTHEYLGRVLEVKADQALIEVRNKFQKDDILQFFGPHLDVFNLTFKKGIDEATSEVIEVCNNPMSKVWIKLPFKVEADYLIRKYRL